MRYKRSDNRTSPISLTHVVILLICAVLVSSRLTGGLYASYVSNSESDDTARVIEFKDLTIDNYVAVPTLMLLPGTELDVAPTVSFEGSESSVFVFLEVKVSDHWSVKTVSGQTVFYVANDNVVGDDVISWKLHADWHLLEDTTDVGSYVFYYKGERLIPNTLISAAPIVNGGVVKVSNRASKADIDALAGLDLQFRAKAIQSGGFYNESDPALAAWNELKKNGG